MKSTHLGFRHLAIVLCFGAYALQATTFTVTRTNVTGPGSLPVIINQANATPGHNFIEFAVTNAILLVSPLPPITNNVTIHGRKDVPTVISGGGTVPIFTFAAGTTNILSQLFLVNGYTTGRGAAISNAGTLDVSGCVMTNNSAGNGGAVFSSGSMTIVNTSLQGNRATNSSPGNGGAVYSSGSLTIASTSLQGNRATNGGAVYNAGSLILASSPLSNNKGVNGGAIYSMGTLTANQLLLSNNTASLGFGGGIYNLGSVIVLASTFAYNQTIGGPGGYDGQVGGGGGGAFGGGLFSLGGAVLVTNSTFFGNSAIGGEGGGYQLVSTAPWARGGGSSGGIGGIFGASGGFGGGGAGGYPGPGNAPGNGGFGGGGGGGYNVANGVGGFGGGHGATNALGGTGPGGGGAGMGGGVCLEAGGLTLVNCTIAGNLVSGGLPGAPWTLTPHGTAGQGIGGGIFNHSGTVTLLNTILAGNVATNDPRFASDFTVAGNPNTGPDIQGTVVSTGFNLIGSSQGATGLSINDFQDVAADLGPLQDNGGSTLTCVPLQGSLAIGYGTSAGAPSADQRGVPRPRTGAVDMGAVQTVTGAPVNVGPYTRNASGFSFTVILDATNSYRVRGSTNLITWVDVTNFPNGGVRHFLDPSATKITRRFYRAVAP